MKFFVYRSYCRIYLLLCFLHGEIRKSFLQKKTEAGNQYEQDKCTAFDWSASNADWQIRRTFLLGFALIYFRLNSK